MSEAQANDESDASTPPPRRSALHVVAWGLATFAGSRLLELFLESQSMAVAVGQAVLAEWGSSRLGVSWSATEARPAAIAKRALVGAALGFAAAAALLFVLRATNAIVVQRALVRPEILALGLAAATLRAMRDELLLHGVTLQALADVRAALPRVLACGATSAGAALGAPGANARSVLVQALVGIGLGALWVQDRGAWRPWAAHAAWLFATGTLLQGGIVEARVVSAVANAPAAGAGGLSGGSAAVMALAPFAVSAIVWAARRSSANGPMTEARTEEKKPGR